MGGCPCARPRTPPAVKSSPTLCIPPPVARPPQALADTLRTVTRLSIRGGSAAATAGGYAAPPVPQQLNLSPFPALAQLELQGCILTPACLAAVAALKPQLRELTVSDCAGVGSLGALLTAGKDPAGQWARLVRLRVQCCGCAAAASSSDSPHTHTPARASGALLTCPHGRGPRGAGITDKATLPCPPNRNRLVAADPSLRLAPALTQLDLSRNAIASADGLQARPPIPHALPPPLSSEPTLPRIP